MTTSLGSAPAPGHTPADALRNFCIIAHIDHGKSTLADRMLQITGVVDDRSMRAQYLDRMDIERERGITIKSQAVRLPFTAADDRTLRAEPHRHAGARRLHLTRYPQSRRLRGAVLLVDAAQGIEAQTLANLWLAMEHDLVIIPVLNKIDLPAADRRSTPQNWPNIIGCSPSDVLHVSAKTGDGVEALLNEVVHPDPRPKGRPGRCCPAHDLRLGLRHVPRRGHLRAQWSTGR